MTARELRRVFQRILTVSLASGCGGEIDRSEFTLNLCSTGANNPLAGVTPANVVDYMELRSGVSLNDPTMFALVAKQGLPCAKATTPACADTLAKTFSADGWSTSTGDDIGPSFRYLVVTRGDTVETITSLASLKQFLAPIDNENEAVFLLGAALPTHSLLCDGNNAQLVSGGFNFATTSGYACGEGSNRDEHVVNVSSTGEVTITDTVVVEEGSAGCAIGRRPEGLEGVGASCAEDRVGAYFANAARLEAASVHAFARLEHELKMHGAPGALIREARRARRDEMRHARMTRGLAKRNGAVPVAARVRRTGQRSLLAFVKENAVEGCVRETFGALVATYQSTHATDKHIARVMSVIAADETRHAALAWRVSKWAMDKLSAEQRADVVALRRSAVGQLERALGTSDGPEPRAGLPGRAASLELLHAFSNALGMRDRADGPNELGPEATWCC